MKLLLKILGGLLAIVLVLVAYVWVTLRPNLPETTFALQPPEFVGGKHVLLFGATGKLGVEIVEDLVARGDKVTAFVRESSDRTALEPLGVEFATGDANSAEAVLAAFQAGEFDAAITTLGGMRADTPPDYIGNVNVFDGARATGVQRVIMISTVGAGNSEKAAPFLSRLALAKILPLKTQAEDYLRESGLDYTIIRPGGLPFGPGTGNGLLSEDPTTMGFITRPDLARLVIGVLDDDRTIGKTLAAVDPTLTSPFDGGA